MSNSKPNLSNQLRNQVAQFLMLHYNAELGGRKLERGKIAEASLAFGVTRRTVSRIWNKAVAQMQQGKPIYLSNQKVGYVRKRKLEVDAETIKAISKKKRKTITGLASALKVGRTTIWRWKKEKKIRVHTNAIKPHLTPGNMFERIKWCLSSLYVDMVDKVVKFKSMKHIVHIDEKWFNMTRSTERYYVVEGEEEPLRTCKSKRFITKAMFECAVSRPIYDANGELIFDGKIGIFPLVNKIPAKRNSKNRVKGTLETKPIDSVTRQVMKSCLINQVVPAIKAKWPSCASRDIIIQQDNCKVHIDDSDPDFKAVASSDGFNMHLVNQPPNSPDLNINDLGFFRAIQSLQSETAAYNIDEMIEAVEISFEALSHTTLNKVFLSLQACMLEVLTVRGNNNYRLPHLKKDRLSREGRLMVDLEADATLVSECIDYLVAAGEADGLGELASDVDSLAQTQSTYMVESFCNYKGYPVTR